MGLPHASKPGSTEYSYRKKVMQNLSVDYSRKWYVMTAIAMSIFLATVDESIVNVALPTLVRTLDTNFATVQWVVMAYLLTQTTIMLSIGRLGDMIGKRPIFISGFVVFIVGSVLCGIAPSIYWLIAFRVIQAIGAAMALALSFALAIEAFPPYEKGKVMGAISTIVSIGIVLGPTLGGFIIQSFSWRWIFFVNLPIGLVGIAIAWRYIPDTKGIGQQRFDYGGAITLLVSLLSLLLALTFGQRAGFSTPFVGLLFAISVVFGVAFVLVEWYSSQPMIDLRLFENKLFSLDLVARITTFFTLAGSLILLPFYLENILGYDPQQMGLLLVVVPIWVGITSPLAGILADRFNPRPLMIAGLVSWFIGFLALSSLNAQTTTLGYILRVFPLGIGLGLFQPPNNSSIMGTAPAKQLGVISGLLSLTRTLGQTPGIAMLGALWAGRIVYYYGAVLPGGATTAPIEVQILGLRDTFLVAATLNFIALMLSIWAFIQERQARLMVPVPAES